MTFEERAQRLACELNQGHIETATEILRLEVYRDEHRNPQEARALIEMTRELTPDAPDQIVIKNNIVTVVDKYNPHHQGFVGKLVPPGSVTCVPSECRQEGSPYPEQEPPAGVFEHGRRIYQARPIEQRPRVYAPVPNYQMYQPASPYAAGGPYRWYQPNYAPMLPNNGQGCNNPFMAEALGFLTGILGGAMLPRGLHGNQRCGGYGWGGRPIGWY
jgi:hypothetical protein